MKQSVYDRVWLNGEIMPAAEAQVSVLTHGLHYGTSVFEGQRAYNGQIFELSRHSRRLHQSAAILGFYIPYSISAINEAALLTLAANQLHEVDDAYIRPVAWYGTGQEPLNIKPSSTQMNLAIAAWRSPSPRQQNRVGLNLCLAKWARPAPHTSPAQAKSSYSYGLSVMAKNEAAARGYDDGLMLDYRGKVAETSAANIFMVKDNELHTPRADCFLNGITRQIVLEMAQKRRIKCHERDIDLPEMLQADEVFICGTAAELHDVVAIEDHKFHSHKPLYHQLLADYLKRVYI